ncbi:MAG: NAD(P)H-dependent oxidoreductase subunit E [Clostridia bacterium]|nr:NAD(P)H-dependent oxidoreductase subunit E [Clostridia bacterium]
MSEKKTIPFQGTAQQEQELLAVIERHREEKGALIPVLHEAQDIYGYLPIEVQTIIAEQLGIPLSEVYGVVTFYTQFSINPKGAYQIGVCLGTACYVKGSQGILDKIQEKLNLEVGECTPDGKFSLTATRCIGACGLAPVMTVNDDVYGRLVEGDVEGILQKYMD